VQSTTTAPLTPQEKGEALTALLQAGLVREQTNLFALLNYLGQKSLAAEGESLKEYTIGVEALGKPRDYDPRLDATVRVDIGKLRAKLKEHYLTTAARQPVHLEIPKGRYDLVYTRNAVAPETIAPTTPPIVAAAPARLHWPVYAAAGLAMILLSGIFGYLFAAANRSSSANATLAPELRSFWQPFLDAAKPTLLVYGTPMFVKLDRFMYRETRLNHPDEIAGDAEVKKLATVLGTNDTRPIFKFTGVGEAEGLFRLTRLLTEQRVPLAVHRSSNLSWENWKDKNVIVLGSQKYNPQIPQLPQQPKYEADRGRVTNLAPQAGEPTEYRNVFNGEFGEPVEAYAVISAYPGLTPNTRLLVLSCSSNEGTGAAAEYVTAPDLMRKLRQKMNLKSDAAWPVAFQAIVKVKLNESVPVHLEYVTHHVLP
jgi:hypothetical protein